MNINMTIFDAKKIRISTHRVCFSNMLGHMIVNISILMIPLQIYFKIKSYKYHFLIQSRLSMSHIPLEKEP